MIANIFYDRNPDAFADVDDDQYARVFHQISSVIFEEGFRRAGSMREHCEHCYTVLCRELGVNELMNRVHGNPYFENIVGHPEACRIFIGDVAHHGFSHQPRGEFYRKKLSLAELLLRQIAYTLRRARRNNVAETIFAELNERLQRANFPYRYHAGVFQDADDDLTEAEIDTPFWNVIADPMWQSVDDEMKDAFDTRANNGVDPAYHAAKALESAVKIISDQKGWTRGNETGAAQYIDNLVSERNGRFLDVWESDLLKAFFAKVRNPMGHGQGSQIGPRLTPHQTDWAIDQSMAWIKNLVRRAT
jgi:hypothetical protein